MPDLTVYGAVRLAGIPAMREHEPITVVGMAPTLTNPLLGCSTLLDTLSRARELLRQNLRTRAVHRSITEQSLHQLHLQVGPCSFEVTSETVARRQSTTGGLSARNAAASDESCLA